MYNNPLARSLNTITMHKLVQIILMGQLLISCVLGAFGFIAYGPPQILLTAVVIVAVSIGANAGLSRIYGVRSDSQSALITGLILALVLTPTFNVLGLIVFALIAIIAQASKYVIAIGGRHIFNPAAVALVIASTVSLGYASWWIASPPMAIFTLFAAFVLLYKLRLLRMGAVFVAVSATIITIQSLLINEPLGSAILLTFTSWPILFVAAFMLTEPTTLPPRTWQKILVAAIVGVIFALPFSIGIFSSSPATALIIGNLVAFFFGQRHAIILKLTKVNALTPTSKEFVFTPATPARFQSGQYLELFLPHKKADFKASRRSFSLTSVPGTNELSLGIRFTEPVSSFKARLLELKRGDTLVASQISGDFVLPKDPAQKLLFIAGGIGITPFISHMRTLGANKESRDIVVLNFTRPADANAYKDVLNTVTTHTYTDGERLTADQLVNTVPDITERTVYISGPPAMVDATKISIKKAGARTIKTDYFSGY